MIFFIAMMIKIAYVSGTIPKLHESRHSLLYVPGNRHQCWLLPCKYCHRTGRFELMEQDCY